MQKTRSEQTQREFIKARIPFELKILTRKGLISNSETTRTIKKCRATVKASHYFS